MGTPADYHLLSAAEKRQFAMDRIREPDIACPYCGTRTLVKDLVAHVRERCPGQAPVHGRAAWVTWARATALGVRENTLSRWVSAGRVRSRGPRGRREYLLRDLVTAIALAERRRRLSGSPNMVTAKPATKALTKRPRKRHTDRMADPLATPIRKRLKRFADKVGGYAPAGRRLDISVDTIRRAATGENIRKGTATLIEAQLERAESKK